tara:strand:+ start:435 stop:1385 length:951 start_codon:yes stop_codon:yes gene_type:complete
MVFISKNIPRYREIILNKAQVAFYSYNRKSFVKQKWLLNDAKSLTLSEVFKQNIFIVSDYNLVSVFFIFYARIFRKTCYIASDWNEVQKISGFTKIRKYVTELFAHGFIQGSPLSAPISKKTKISALLYMTSIISFKQNLNINREIDFVYIGQLIDRKRISYVVKVFNELTIKGYKCEIHGFTGLESPNIKEICKSASFPVNSSCSWKECQKILANSSTLFYPSKEDVWGLTITESLNNGCMPMFSEAVISGEYYSKVIPQILNFKLKLKIDQDITNCEKVLNISIEKRFEISTNFRKHEELLVKKSVNSLKMLKH